jgi:IS30 family transposase
MNWVHLTVGQKQMARRLKAKGLKVAEIARELGCSTCAVQVTVRGNQLRPGRADEWTPAPGRLSAEEREDILVGLRAGESMSAIARRLGRAPCTVTREVAANGGPNHYGAWRAQCRAREAARRPKTAKLCHGPLVAQVSAWLEEWWSPEEISRRLRAEFGNDPMMQVSHETIYQSLFVQGRGELRRELARCLRSGRTQRRPRSKVDKRGKIPGMVMISQRPSTVSDRVSTAIENSPPADTRIPQVWP